MVSKTIQLARDAISYSIPLTKDRLYSYSESTTIDKIASISIVGIDASESEKFSCCSVDKWEIRLQNSVIADLSAKLLSSNTAV